MTWSCINGRQVARTAIPVRGKISNVKRTAKQWRAAGKVRIGSCRTESDDGDGDDDEWIPKSRRLISVDHKQRVKRTLSRDVAGVGLKRALSADTELWHHGNGSQNSGDDYRVQSSVRLTKIPRRQEEGQESGEAFDDGASPPKPTESCSAAITDKVGERDAGL